MVRIAFGKRRIVGNSCPLGSDLTHADKPYSRTRVEPVDQIRERAIDDLGVRVDQEHPVGVHRAQRNVVRVGETTVLARNGSRVWEFLLDE